jgi:hypothetical protein
MEDSPRARFGPFSFLAGFALGVFLGVGLALAAVVVSQDDEATSRAPLVLGPTETPDPLRSPSPAPERPVRTTTTLDVRLGPGQGFAIIGSLGRGEAIEVVGRDAEGQWVAIRFPPGSVARGWVPVSAVENLNDVDALAIVLPTPLPRTVATPSPAGVGPTNGGALPPIPPDTTPIPGQPSATPTPGPPDLVVSRMEVLPDGRVAITIGNRGPGDLTGQILHIQIRNLAERAELITTPRVSLRAGQTLTVQTEVFRVVGEEEVVATVDPFGTLREADRANNTLQVTLVQPRTPTPTPAPFADPVGL